MFLRPSPSLILLVCVVAAWLAPGQAGWSYAPKPSNLNEDYYWVRGYSPDSSNPWGWACKGGSSLLHGQLNDAEWKIYGNPTTDDAECLSQIVFGSTQASNYSPDGPTPELYWDVAGAKIPIGKLHSRKLVKSREYDRININTIYSLVRNLHNRTQEGSTPSFSQSTTDTHEVSIELSTSVSASAKVGIPLVGETEIQVTVGASYTTTSSVSKTRTIEAPSQKITLDPHTEATVAFTFHKKQTRNDYMLEFTVDEDAATFNKLKDQINNKDVRVKLNRGNSGPALRLENGKWIVSGFPATEIFWSYGTQVVLGRPHPVPDDDILTWAAPSPDVHVIDLESNDTP